MFWMWFHYSFQKDCMSTSTYGVVRLVPNIDNITAQLEEIYGLGCVDHYGVGIWNFLCDIFKRVVWQLTILICETCKLKIKLYSSKNSQAVHSFLYSFCVFCHTPYKYIYYTSWGMWYMLTFLVSSVLQNLLVDYFHPKQIKGDMAILSTKNRYVLKCIDR